MKTKGKPKVEMKMPGMPMVGGKAMMAPKVKKAKAKKKG